MNDNEALAGRIAENYRAVLQRVERSANLAGRDRRDVQVIGVTKYVDSVMAGLLVDAGCNQLGESRPQVLFQKAEDLKKRDVKWHMIGHLQRNKVGKTLQHASLVHSVDSLRLAQAIDRLANEHNLMAEILVEVNISGDNSKHGVSPDQLEDLLQQIVVLDCVSVRGLMGMAGLTSDESQTRRQFATLRDLRDQLRGQLGHRHSMNELSMGMSGDFELAIAEGATLIRIGSILFEGCR